MIHDIEYGLYWVAIRCVDDPSHTWHLVDNDAEFIYCPTCEDDLNSIRGDILTVAYLDEGK